MMASFRKLRPALAREAETAVHMVHDGDDAEDCFFLFDYEDFIDRSRAGLFVRPVLRIFAGREDISRRRLFARELDRMRAELGRGRGRIGWLGGGSKSVLDPIGGLVANLALAVAMPLGRQVLSMPGLARVLKGRRAEAKPADRIDRTRGQAEAALARIEVPLNPELYAHAFRHGSSGPRAGLDRAAWPLRDHVRAHLGDGASGASWCAA